MPLPRFTLADLTPEQMVTELLRRLPAHTPSGRIHSRAIRAAR